MSLGGLGEAVAAPATPAERCASAPQNEIGPFFADDAAAGFKRGDIRSNVGGGRTERGVPLALVVYVVDARNGCSALRGTQVDIWQCNAAGVYSDEANEATQPDTWLRGYQIADGAGRVAFKTIVPGWYEGRTTHIHLRVRSSYSEVATLDDSANTTQLFFPQDLIDRLSRAVAPYNARGVNDTTNARDRVYNGERGDANQLVLRGSPAAGFAATFKIGLPIV